MNRRTVLQSAGVAAAVSLAGCVEGVQEHFQGSVQSPVPIEISNEGEYPHNIRLDGRARDGDRQTYEEAYAVVPGEQVWAPQIEGSEQQFRATRYGEDGDAADVETVEITDSAQLVLIRIYDDDLELELITDEDEAEERQEDGDADEVEEGDDPDVADDADDPDAADDV